MADIPDQHFPAPDALPAEHFLARLFARMGARMAGRIADWRNARVADPAFQNWALSFPPTRPLVRKRQKQLFDLTAGFVYSQILQACVQLDIFMILKAGPMNIAALADRIGLERRACERLVAAAASLSLLRFQAEWVRLDDLGAALVANPGVQAMIAHHALFYRDLEDPVALLRGEKTDTELCAFWGYATARRPGALGRERIDAYSHLMAASQAMVAAEVLAAYPFARHRKLLDVGGGEGAFVSHVGRAHPVLHLATFDLPAVAARAREKMHEAGLSARFTAHSGSFFEDRLPLDADVVSLIRVLYDHDDEKVLTILSAVRAALPKGGVLVVAEPMADTPGAEAMGSAYFGFYLMAMQSGQCRNYKQIKYLLNRAGFQTVKRLKSRSPVLTSVVTAMV